MDCECIENVGENDWTKIAKTDTGHQLIGGHDIKTPTGQSAKEWADELPDTFAVADCNQCKHKLACLVDSECDRWFESK